MKSYEINFNGLPDDTIITGTLEFDIKGLSNMGKQYYIAVFKRHKETKKEFVGLHCKERDTGLYEYDFAGFYARSSLRNNKPFLHYSTYIQEESEFKKDEGSFFERYCRENNYLTVGTIINYKSKNDAERKITELKEKFKNEYKFRVIRFF